MTRSRRLQISLITLGVAVVLLLGLALANWSPEVRRFLAPLHDRLYLELRGEWITRHSPTSQLMVATLGLMTLYFWLCWFLCVRSLRGILLGLLAWIIWLDKQSRLFRAVLSLRNRLGHRLGPRFALGPRNRPGFVSRSYLQVLGAVVEEEERRYHASGDQAMRRSLGAHLRGYGELFLPRGTTPDPWALRHALFYLGEAVCVGESCEGRFWEVASLGLRVMLSRDSSSSSEEDVAPVSRVLAGLDNPTSKRDATFLFLCLIHRYLREPHPGLGALLRSRIETSAAGLLDLARSLAQRSRLSYGEIREQRRRLDQFRVSSGAFHLLSIAPGYARILRSHSDTPGLRAWMDLLDEISKLFPRLRRMGEAEGIIPLLARDIGDGQLLEPRVPAAVEAELLRAEVADGEGEEDHALENRFALLNS